MRLSLVVAAATALGLTDAASNMLTPYGALNKRQAFNPDETTGTGSTCVEAFGEGYIECVPASSTKPRLCINPDLGEKCCDQKWGCPSQSFCLVQDLCCPDSLDPQTCAAQNDVTLPSDFSIPATSMPTARPSAEPSAEPSCDHSPSSMTVSHGGHSGTGTGTSHGNGTRTSRPPIQTAGAQQQHRVGALAIALGLAAVLVL